MKMHMKCEEYDLEIDLTLLTPEEGGRMQGIRSGYRCTVDLAGSYWVTEFHLSDQNREWLNPGETDRVLVYTVVPNLMLEYLTWETPLLLREGGRLVGCGRVVEFLNLKKHAEQVKRQQEEQEKRRQEGEKSLSKASGPHLSTRPYTHKKKQRKNK